MRMRLWDTPSRPAKGRLSSNGTLGTMFTDSPLEYAAVSVLQPGWGPLLAQDTPSFTVGWCSGENSWVGMEQDPDTSTTSCKLSHCTRDPVSGRPHAWLALNISKVQVFCNPLLPSTVWSPRSCSWCLHTLCVSVFVMRQVSKLRGAPHALFLIVWGTLLGAAR